MQNTVINFTTEEKIKRQALSVAKKKGVSLDTLINDYLKEGIQSEKKEELDETPSKWLIEELKNSEEDVKAGRVTTFNSPQEALDYLDREIENERRKISKN